MTTTEEKITKATESVEALPEPEEGDDAQNKSQVKTAESAVQEAQIAVKTMKPFLESQARAQGAKEVISKLEPRLKACQERLDTLSANLKQRGEKIIVGGALKEARQKVVACEEAITWAVDAEKPFLQNDNDIDPNKVTELEKGIQGAQQLASSAKTMISMKKLNVKRLSESASQAALAELTTMSNTIDEAMKKLTTMKGRCVEWKKKSIRSKATAKLSTKA